MSSTRHALDLSPAGIVRRNFLKGSALAAAATTCAPLTLRASENSSTPESLVKVLYDKLSEQQRSAVCFDWDYVDNGQESKRGLLRTRVANNWNITKQSVNSDFYTPEQRDIVRKIFEGILDRNGCPSSTSNWKTICGGFGQDQSFAIFGKPGDGKFEFVYTGRHMTLRCDGNSAEGVALVVRSFGHKPNRHDEDADHSGNVFWTQALQANKVYGMLDGKQRKLVEVSRTPREEKSGFRARVASSPACR